MARASVLTLILVIGTASIIKAFQLSGSGTLNVEFGFGVVRDETAGFASTEIIRGEAGLWRANLPATTIAIFHTHRS